VSDPRILTEAKEAALIVGVCFGISALIVALAKLGRML
jgi:hypothetical protein